MIDLHSHILPNVDDGSTSIEMSLEMAARFVEQGVTHVACTPHILPGVYHNTGLDIRQRIVDLQTHLDEAGIALTLVTGADNHIIPDFVAGLAAGHLLSLADSPYVLVEPPHHVAPLRLEELFFSILVAGYVPILTHPERLTWIEQKYDVMARLVQRGVWMQITSGSLRGAFGRRPRYWAERMLDDGLCHVIATDAHNLTSRRPDLAEGRDAAATRVGAVEAEHLVVTRPYAILSSIAPRDIPAPRAVVHAEPSSVQEDSGDGPDFEAAVDSNSGGFARRLRRLFR